MKKSLPSYLSSSTVELRYVQDGDIRTLVDIINDAYIYQDKAKGGPRTNVGHLTKRIIDTDFYVVTAEDKVVGCVYLESHGSSMHFGLLTIIPELRGTGLGSGIIEAIRNYSIDSCYVRIELDYMSLAPWLKKYYERYGFGETGERVAWGSIDLIRMRLDLEKTSARSF